MRIDACLIAVALAGCGPPGAPPRVTELAGEITVHAFPGWTHAWAVFLDPGVPVGEVREDSILSLPPSPSVQLGPCEVWSAPRCTLPCGPDGFCQADDRCTAYPRRSYLDDGEIAIAGGPVEVRLRFDAQHGLYDSAPPPGPATVFAGGELMRVSSGALRTELRAPSPVEVTSSLSPLHAPASGAWTLAWTPGDAELIEIVLASSSTIDPTRSTIVRCLTGDGGAFAVPAEVLARLPPAPRTLHLEVTRNTEKVVARGGGRGVLVHLGYTFAVDGMD